MPWLFRPPIELLNPPVGPEHRGVAYRLFRYLGPQPVGVSVVGPYPNYATVQTPDQLTLAGMRDGVDYFLGGHEYVVSDAVATALMVSGYGATPTEVEWGGLSESTWESLNTWEEPL